ncbi:MAG: 2-phospho-L-lactate guanylyltransferase [Armatimonadetes bacterium]|nr:2-phospho-L-lactate guanylyltransferase [Armatimonadota bacterium]MDW8153393.1 2-phospho-L-lactate guanylyltransferase [Armatimonadota bacterium]
MRVLIPIKPLRAAKSRLAPVLPSEERMRLVLWMLERVLRSCREAGISEVFLVGGDPWTTELGRRYGTRFLPELGQNLNQTLERALALVRGEEACLIVAADLPLLRPEELARMVRLGKAWNAAVLAPSRDGGTNALLLPPASAWTPRFGPHSAARHRSQLVAAGAVVREIRTLGLMHDVDRPHDLTEAVRSLPGFPLRESLASSKTVVEPS